ncbi:D-aminoacyl-tRNA deacylase 2-like isoform X2 [Scophthalmus maximus]|uniref:D-aminoacyl-tRNA deacylase 2-like isoform X2 n=1 Tax=Scophthalmus maximus TaxID=52904 RepID=UPI0015E11137|nr:D-aminoacyl-tRNA deacylase 2-like isoform X2 [Scophthalmus maximus]
MPSSVVRGHRTVKARTVVQQCRQAKVRIRTSLDGAEAQWVEIQEGVVDYVCFYRGATEGITRKMADRLMTTKLFRKDTRECVSVLDLPGSVLLVPRDSLLGEPGPERKVQYRGRCQPELGALLFSSLASPCRELMLGSASCTDGGMKVEQGVYGQRQEMVLSSVELLTLLLEF